MTVLLGALLPLFLPSHLESFSEYDSYLKTNYLLAKLIPIPQQGAIGPTGLESAAVWLMNEHLLDAGYPHWNCCSAWLSICFNFLLAAGVRRPKWVYSRDSGLESLAQEGNDTEDKGW